MVEKDSQIIPGDAKSRSANRLHYEAQVEVIRRQLGDLEKIRENLGLSQRKIAQLLMVDPSAWTRWTKKGEDAPPHIYRALQWYSILQEKIPGLTPQYFVGKDPEVLHQAAIQKLNLETEQRKEFEEAMAAQTLKLEERLENILEKNQGLLGANLELKTQISALRQQIKRNQVAIGVLAGALFLALIFRFFI